jgi:glycosyltransferase involved in cell wall biosynthesis
MKIWHLISNRWNSAISEYAISAARATQGLGADVLVTALAGSPVERRILGLGIKSGTVEHFGPAHIAQLAAAAKKWKPDVIMTYGGPETTAAQFFKGTSRIIRFYGYQSIGDGPLVSIARKIGQKMGHVRVDQLITPADVITSNLRQHMTCPVITVTLGCDEQVFRPNASPNVTRPRLLIFGRLDPVKGHREFLPVFKEILRQWSPDALRPQLRIVGLPANLSAAHLWLAVRDTGLSADDVEIVCEQVADVPRELSSATVGVVSSLGSEAICRVAEEFLLCGTPVVSTATGSLPEIYHEALFGQVYRSDGAAEAAAQIVPLLKLWSRESAAERELRSQAARRYFSIEAMTSALGKVLAINER